MTDKINFVDTIKIELKRKTPEELTEKICELVTDNIIKDKEIERLKNGYCELKVKCNNGECDCTNEEYDEMVESNIKLCNDLDDYKSRNEKAIEYIDKELKDLYKSNHQCKHLMEITYLENIKEILEGDKDE